MTDIMRVAIVEDEPLYRELLAHFLSSTPGFDVVGSVGTVEDGRALVLAQKPDLVIVDIELPDGNGIGLGVSLRRELPNLGILLLSEKDLYELVRTLPRDVQRGWSYLSKKSAVDLKLLLAAMQSTVRGYAVIDPRLVERSSARAGTGVAALTRRQFEVLRVLATGKSTEAIAAELGVNANTVVNALTAIYATLQVPEDANPRVYAVLQFLADTANDLG